MCTAVRFSNEEGSPFLGRNLDWSCGYGEKVRIMPKGFMVPWAFKESTPARHAVIGMCVEFQNYPLFFDCGNVPLATIFRKFAPGGYVSADGCVY